MNTREITKLERNEPLLLNTHIGIKTIKLLHVESLLHVSIKFELPAVLFKQISIQEMSSSQELVLIETSSFKSSILRKKFLIYFFFFTVLDGERNAS